MGVKKFRKSRRGSRRSDHAEITLSRKIDTQNEPWESRKLLLSKKAKKIGVPKHAFAGLDKFLLNIQFSPCFQKVKKNGSFYYFRRASRVARGRRAELLFQKTKIYAPAKARWLRLSVLKMRFSLEKRGTKVRSFLAFAPVRKSSEEPRISQGVFTPIRVQFSE